MSALRGFRRRKTLVKNFMMNEAARLDNPKRWGYSPRVRHTGSGARTGERTANKHPTSAKIDRRGASSGFAVLGRGSCANRIANVGSIEIEPFNENIGVSHHRVRGGSMDMFGKTAAASAVDTGSVVDS